MILVDRSSPESRKAVFNATRDKINKGINVCLFPEGTVPPVEIQLGEFKQGAFSIAIGTSNSNCCLHIFRQQKEISLEFWKSSGWFKRNAGKIESNYPQTYFNQESSNERYEGS